MLDGTDPNCVPYDIFSAPRRRQASINYLNVFGVIEGQTSEQIANVNFTGALGEYGVQTPWADDGVGVNFGVEYRKESLILNPDQSFQTGDLAGQGAPTLPVNGNFKVLELFGEAQIPIVQQQLHRRAVARRRLSQVLATSSATAASMTPTPTRFGAEFAPIRDVRFRGVYNRAVRAPNIQELFAPQFVGLDGANDPCAGTPITATDFGCLAQGLRGRPEPDRRTRPASITACSAATRT